MIVTVMDYWRGVGTRLVFERKEVKSVHPYTPYYTAPTFGMIEIVFLNGDREVVMMERGWTLRWQRDST